MKKIKTFRKDQFAKVKGKKGENDKLIMNN